MPTNLHHVLPDLSSGPQSGPSGIREAVYVPDQHELQIIFKSGRTFAYSDVPQTMFDAFVASPSKGSFFNIAIRGRFHFRELTSPQPPTQH